MMMYGLKLALSFTGLQLAIGCLSVAARKKGYRKLWSVFRPDDET